jgi:hypothetical protein
MIAAGFEADGERRVVAHPVHERFLTEPQIGSKPVCAFETLGEHFDPAEHDMFGATEHARQNADRGEVLDAAKRLGHRPASLISPGARVGEHNYFGSGFFADRNATIGSFSTFGGTVRVVESVRVHDRTFLKPFHDVEETLSEPTFIHAALRAPGRIVDRRTSRP